MPKEKDGKRRIDVICAKNFCTKLLIDIKITVINLKKKC
jgi:hypothetical protein